MTSRRLAKNALAIGGQVVQSLAHIAPAVAVVFTASVLFSGASTAAPLAILVSCLGVLPSVYLHSKLQARWSGAGGYCSVLPPALNGTIGVAAGLLDFFYEPFVASFGIFGLIAFGIEPGIGRTLTFWEVMLISQGLVLAIYLLARREVKVVTRLLLIFGCGEILLFVALAILLVAQSPVTFHSFASMFSPEQFDLGGFARAALFGTLMFVGFESGIAFSSETRDATRSFRCGIWFSTVVSALVFISSFGAVVLAASPGGPLAGMSVEVAGDGGSPYFDLIVPAVMGKSIGHGILVVVLFLSVLSCGMAAFGAGARNLFALGRIGALPRFVAESSSGGVPVGGVKGCYIISVVVALLLAGVDAPAVAFEIGGAFYASVAIVFYCLVSFAGLRNCRQLGGSPAGAALIALLSLLDLTIFSSLITLSLIDYASKDGPVAVLPLLLGGVLTATTLWAVVVSFIRPRVVARLRRPGLPRGSALACCAGR